MRIIAAARSSCSHLALACLLFSAACDLSHGPSVVGTPEGAPLPTGPTIPAVPTSMEVFPGVVKLTIGGTYALTADARDRTGSPLAGLVVDWRSSDTNVVAVDAGGIVVGRALGAATITAATSGLQDSATIVVRKVNPFDLEFSTLSTVGNYACGLQSVTGLAYCWGDNHSGAMGIGDEEWLELPMLVGYGRRRFRSLSVSAYSNCAIEVGTDLPFCWGAIRDESLSYGAWPNWVTVPTLVGGGRFRFSTIAAGTEVTCGIDVQTNRAYCWGLGDLVGDGTGITRFTLAQVGGEDTDLRFATLSASPGVVCGIESGTARAYCWGRNESGQIGDGTRIARAAPALVANGSIHFSAISAGQSVVCGIEAQTARALCWGANSLGQLGDGSVTSRLLPTPVAGADLRFSSIEAGPNMVCAVEAETEAAYCWGRNKYGSLGDGTNLDRRQPTPVAGGIRFASLSTGGAGGGYGGFETCGVQAETGRAFCWGFGRAVPTAFEKLASWPPSTRQPNAPVQIRPAE